MSTAQRMKRLPQGPLAVARADVNTRAAFITRVYMHLLMAILIFAGIQVALFQTGIADIIARTISGERWLLAFAGFQIVAWFARRAASRARSLSSQYLALGAFIIAQAIIFVPLLRAAQNAAPGVLESAVLTTASGFLGLTAVAFVTRKDSSFLGGILRFGFTMALVLIVAALLFGFRLGVYFNVGMVALAGGAILRDTSRVLHKYPKGHYVSAALELFASATLLFWHVLRLTMRSSRQAR